MQVIVDNLNLIVLATIGGVAAVIALWCLFTGLKRGTIRSTVRLLTVVVSAGGAILLVSILSSTLLPKIEPAIKTYVVNFLTGLNETAADVVNSSEDLVNYIVELVFALVNPVLFATIFLVFLLLTLPIYGLLKLFIPRGDGIRFPSRLLGAVVSLAGALVIAFCCVMPVTGYLTVVADAYPVVMATGFVSEESMPAGLGAQLAQTKENLAVKTINTCGGTILFDSLTRVGESTAAKETTYLLETVNVTIPAIQQLMEDNAHATEGGQIQPLHLNAVRDVLLPQLEQAPLRVRSIFAEIIGHGAGKWTNGEAFLGIDPDAMLGPEFAASVNILLDHLATTEGETLSADLREFSIMAEDLSLCLSHFKHIQTANPIELVAAGKQKLDLTIIRRDVLPLIDTSEAAAVERAFFADVMRRAAESWQEGKTYLDVDMQSILGNFQGSGDVLLERLANTDADHIVADLTAVSLDLEVLSQTYVYFVEMEEGIKDAAQLQERLTDIVSGMTSDTVEVIKGTLKDEIADTVELREGAGAVVDLVGSALENVAELPEEKRAAEADALNQVLNYATGNNTDEVTETAVVDALLASSAVGNAIVETVERNNDPATPGEERTEITVTAEEKTRLDAAVDEKLADDTLTAEQKAMLEAMKGLFVVAP